MSSHLHLHQQWIFLTYNNNLVCHLLMVPNIKATLINCLSVHKCFCLVKHISQGKNIQEPCWIIRPKKYTIFTSVYNAGGTQTKPYLDTWRFSKRNNNNSLQKMHYLLCNYSPDLVFPLQITHTLQYSAGVSVWFYQSNGSFPLSGMGQYSTVRYRTPWSSFSFHCQPYPLLDRRGVCQKVAINNKARTLPLYVSFNEQ